MGRGGESGWLYMVRFVLVRGDLHGLRFEFIGIDADVCGLSYIADGFERSLDLSTLFPTLSTWGYTKIVVDGAIDSHVTMSKASGFSYDRSVAATDINRRSTIADME
ncbi:hypothetical protein Tco_0164229 [Tanacetum coccineum]